jgi:hypothetical protein
MTSVYDEVRLPHDPAREVLWRALWRYYFSQLIRPEDCVLDIAADTARLSILWWPASV